MADERKTSADAYEAFLARTGQKSTMQLIDAFFEGYKSGLADGSKIVMDAVDAAVQEIPA
jgi:hypothetical protein